MLTNLLSGFQKRLSPRIAQKLFLLNVPPCQENEGNTSGCVCMYKRLRQGNQAEWEKTCRLMSSPHGKKSQLLFLSVNHQKWLVPLVLMTLGLYTNETKGFVKDPNHSGSSDVATSGKHTANEPQRALSAQQEGNYNVIPSFNIITIFIAGQEQACCIVSSQSM